LQSSTNNSWWWINLMVCSGMIAFKTSKNMSRNIALFSPYIVLTSMEWWQATREKEKYLDFI
jgi:hypothetical protein